MHSTVTNIFLLLFSLLVGVYSSSCSSASTTAQMHPPFDDHNKRLNPGAAARVGFLGDDPEAMAGFQQ